MFRRYRKFIFTVAFVLVLTSLAALSIYSGTLEFFEQKLLDFRFQVVNPGNKPSQDLVFVQIDEHSLKSLSLDWGTWPWPRGAVMTDRVVNYILEGNPKAVFFDILYPEYSPKQPGILVPEDDVRLALVANAWPNISHAVQFGSYDQSLIEASPQLPPECEYSFEIPLEKSSDAPELLKGYAPTLPYKELLELASNLNLVNESPDDDSISRRYTLVMEYQGKYYPSMALKALNFMWGIENYELRKNWMVLTLADKTIRAIPLTQDGRLRLSFYKDLADIQTFPVDSVVASSQLLSHDPNAKPVIPNDFFTDKIVVIGATATGLHDIKNTPMGVIGGSYLHLTAMSNLLMENYITPLQPLMQVFLIFLSLVAIAAATLYIPQPLLRNTFGILWLAAIMVASVLLFRFFTITVDMANTLVFSLVALIGSIAFLSMTEGAEKRYIRSAFSSYLSPDVIKQLEADPKKLGLGGEKRQMTAMFTDVKGFSTFSEKLDPNDLVHLLNEYLGAMSDIILDNRGTIDKYEGDAIIAFWGAPLDQDDHAILALKSAIAMKSLEKSLNERLITSGLAPSPLLTRFGINSGDMTVGNMGTSRRMNYTVMGNHVNLAARLEGVNKIYGCWILTGKATRTLVGEQVVFRALDSVRVVGISEPIRLYEVVGLPGHVESAVTKGIKIFEKAISLYEKQGWAESESLLWEVLRLMPNDGPSKVFLERIEAYKKNPPPATWDGVFGMNTK